ncbi:MAG TPA: HAD family hydrolase [Micromonosporaceae bacterium]
MTVDAVIFDWGGTLTPWRASDGRAWWRIAARLVPPDQVERVGAALTAAEEALWRRSRDEHVSGTLAEVFAAAGLDDDEVAYVAYDEEWEWVTPLDPDVAPVLRGLRERGIATGVLSNTCWTRAQHERAFAREGVTELIDAAVYTCEIPWTKPHPEAFRAAMTAVGASDPGRCVFVGDRLFDDIFGARQAGMRAILVPHSKIPDSQRGHTDGEPHAVVQRLADVLAIVDAWRAGSAGALQPEDA